MQHNVGFPTNDSSTSHGPYILIGQMPRKPTQRCQNRCEKVVTNKSKTLPNGDGKMCSTVSNITI